MKRQSVLWISLFVLTLVLIFLIPRLLVSQSPQVIPASQDTQVPQDMMNGGMMGGDMGTIHQLFAAHNQIRRTFEEIPNGIRSVTESDTPAIAALIQAHVPNMYQRIVTQQGIPMIRMSSTLPVMARNANQYQRHFEIAPLGLIVTETSDDPQMVATIREHAREVSRFVKEGMPAMMDGMMR